MTERILLYSIYTLMTIENMNIIVRSVTSLCITLYEDSEIVELWIRAAFGETVTVIHVENTLFDKCSMIYHLGLEMWVLAGLQLGTMGSVHWRHPFPLCSHLHTTTIASMRFLHVYLSTTQTHIHIFIHRSPDTSLIQIMGFGYYPGSVLSAVITIVSPVFPYSVIFCS